MTILTPEAQAFVRELHVRFDDRRTALLDARAARRAQLAAGATLDFLPETRSIRESDWTVTPNPAPLQDRRVEITGPVDRKMVINALNSGANGFMACFEDATAPTWENLVAGQRNLYEAVRGTIRLRREDGKVYELGPAPAVLHVRPRGWHLDEPEIEVRGRPVAGAFADAGLFLFHNAQELLARGAGPYLYLPKLESHLEARLWRDVFAWVESSLDLAPGSIRVTVLIETLPAAFEMDEIAYELREHLAGLNAGRWDYIFSAIKCYADRPGFVLPQRGDVTMTVPFMRAYAERLVATCHRRGAHAIGGMAAFIPSRANPEVSERALARVREDKDREAAAGYDGTWVAHPGLVPVARAAFDAVLDGRPNQLERVPPVSAGAAELNDVRSAGTRVTSAGVRGNVAVALEYLATWLAGTGAVAIDDLMEDAATAEISRAQLWQWIRHGVRLDGTGEAIDRALVERLAAEESARLAARTDWPAAEQLDAARMLFDEVTLGDAFVDFLTLPGMRRLRSTQPRQERTTI